MAPAFPRPRSHPNVYTHSLDRGTIQTNLDKLQRIDLQLIAMIEHARAYLAKEGININDKVFMMGFSASGMFTNRFTILHPDKVKAAAI